MSDSEIFTNKDNEFIAWYPNALTPEGSASVWKPRRAAYYVHIPFCTAICDYCGFSVEKAKGAPTERYLDSLRREIERYIKDGRLANHRFECGHFGGGTPSVLEASQLLSIKKLLHDSLNIAPDAEITAEVNPISFTLEKAQAYYDGGINRISFGLQSFNDKVLKVLGRPHRVSDSEEIIKIIRQVGWTNYSLDIIYGVPGQTMEELREDLKRAADTGSTHISCFRLQVVPYTALKLREAAGQLPEQSPMEVLNEMDHVVAEALAGYGYRQYGVFDFAKPGYETVHNAIAFAAPQADYIGFGNSAYSFINQHVFVNYAQKEAYEKAIAEGKDPIAFAKKANMQEMMSRYFVLGVKFLRVPRSGFISEFGVEPEKIFGSVLERLLNSGMLKRDGDDYVLTSKGRYYVNNVSKEFYVGENVGKRQYLQFVSNLSPKQMQEYHQLHAARR
ncbi:radical SAM family heme chaperone HemW [Vitiosangium sp. GDMCC 1.1324]|uniref:radical SAM family heme chaperone HemW n=1 Tax=Vitiosangium sp. (strain GDMCC 1.1324) TaxID=2138576 RepID=UPI00130EFE39|nr:radical SAM family heme chaperone HemW [Vitiosangium sp. GDMCC 1.1324]